MAVIGDETEPTPQRRRYDSPVRRERSAQTRERIVAAGSELAHGFTAWDWRELTFRAVAERAGVNERTVFRHFPTERELHEAVMRRLEEESGVSFHDLKLDDIGDVTARILAAVSSYAITRWPTRDGHEPAVLAAEDHRRRAALVEAVDEAAATWPESQRLIAAATLDLLWSLPSFERLTTWNLDPTQATTALTWLIHLVVTAIQQNRPPQTDPP